VSIPTPAALASLPIVSFSIATSFCRSWHAAYTLDLCPGSTLGDDRTPAPRVYLGVCNIFNVRQVS
jgi:hypothetical protein